MNAAQPSVSVAFPQGYKPMYMATNRSGLTAMRMSSSTCPSAERGSSSLLICPPNLPLIVIKARLPSSFSPSIIAPDLSTFYISALNQRRRYLFAIPLDKRIMNKRFQYTHESICVGSQKSHSDFTSPTKDPIVSSDAHRIDQILR
jgi:hypothetical protein